MKPKLTDILLMLLLLSFSALRPAAAAAKEEAAAAYEGHRALVWALDAKTGKVLGFAQATVAPGKEETLEPVEGYELAVGVSEVATAEFTDDFRTFHEVPAVTVVTRHGTGATHTSYDLASPGVQIQYGFNEPANSLTFLAPVGTLQSEHLNDVLAKEFKGELSDLDALMVAAVDAGYFGLVKAAEVYSQLRDSTLREHWRTLMQSDDGDVARVATGVSAVLGDEDAQEQFAALCLEEEGNRQVEAIDVLTQSMPPSEKFLETMVDLIVTPEREYRIQAPEGVGVSDIDRREGLFYAVVRKYKPEQVRPYEEELTDWAAQPGNDWAKRELEDFFAE